MALCFLLEQAHRLSSVIQYEWLLTLHPFAIEKMCDRITVVDGECLSGLQERFKMGHSSGIFNSLFEHLREVLGTLQANDEVERWEFISHDLPLFGGMIFYNSLLSSTHKEALQTLGVLLCVLI